MALQDRSYAQRPPSSNGLPTGVKWLLIVNTAIFLIAFFITRFTKIDVVHNFALNPSAVVEAFAVWQLFTYMFLHLGALHWLFNAIGLYFFGSTLERIWGTDRFLKFYVTCGLGAAVLGVLGAYLFKRESQFTLGASGAILGLIVGFGVFLAEEQVFFFFIPLKAKYLAMLVGVLAFLQAFDDPVGGIVHLAGGLTGLFVVLRTQKTKRHVPRGMEEPSWIDQLRMKYRTWRVERKRKQFQVYLKKQNGDRDRFN